MTIWKRIKNLWIFSEYEIPQINQAIFPTGTRVTSLIKKPNQMAQIIRMKPKDEVDEALETINPEQNG